MRRIISSRWRWVSIGTPSLEGSSSSVGGIGTPSRASKSGLAVAIRAHPPEAGAAHPASTHISARTSLAVATGRARPLLVPDLPHRAGRIPQDVDLALGV